MTTPDNGKPKHPALVEQDRLDQQALDAEVDRLFTGYELGPTVESEHQVFILVRCNVFGVTRHIQETVDSVRREVQLAFGGDKRVKAIQVEPTDGMKERIDRDV